MPAVQPAMQVPGAGDLHRHRAIAGAALTPCEAPTDGCWRWPCSASSSPVAPVDSGAGCSREKTPLVVFAAGSLIIPFADLEKAFEARYPEIDVQAEYHGSIQVIRHVTELHEAD